MTNLEECGFDSFFQNALASLGAAENQVARVVSEQKDALRLLTCDGEFWGKPSGRLLHVARDRADLPAVGDFVVLRETGGVDADRLLVDAVLPRRTCLSRKAAGEDTQMQIVAANVDTVFVVSSLNKDLNVRRIERYVTAIWSSGAVPVVLLTKADLVEDLEATVQGVRAELLGVDVLPVSVVSGYGVDALAPFAKPGKTIAFVGSSGVGKSTLTNHFLGAAMQDVQSIGDGFDKGRHTTTARQLFRVPSGALVLDTPGMREFAPWDEGGGLEATFADLDELTNACRYGDCRHDTEPGCAVKTALEGGTLDQGRWESYLKLQREQAYRERQQNVKLALEEKKRWKQIHKQAKAHMRMKRG